MTEPPNKKIKVGQEFVDLINECFELKFNVIPKTEVEQNYLDSGIKKIRKTLEQTTSSSEISFGAARTSAKINWGKCLGLLLEDGENSFSAIKVLTERLSPGGGLL